MHWEKLGQLYTPQAVHPKLTSHAANPLAVHLVGNIYRVFYSGRDQQNRSSVGYVDIDVVKYTVNYVHDKPVFEHGQEDSFYSHGVSIGNCYSVGEQRYILFMGWQYPSGEHWRGEVGRLILDNDNSTLKLDSDRPFIPRNDIDPVSLSYPWVIQNSKDNYQMWYGSTMSWDAGNGEMLHVINYATSVDGDNWNRHGLALPYEVGVAQAFSRPALIGSPEQGYHMWFSYRTGAGEKYRIGYAYSESGIGWQLKLNKSTMDVSQSGWDSEMIEYPFVFKHQEQIFMLYNGNGYGESGFGMAVLNSA